MQNYWLESRLIAPDVRGSDLAVGMEVGYRARRVHTGSKRKRTQPWMGGTLLYINQVIKQYRTTTRFLPMRRHWCLRPFQPDATQLNCMKHPRNKSPMEANAVYRPGFDRRHRQEGCGILRLTNVSHQSDLLVAERSQSSILNSLKPQSTPGSRFEPHSIPISDLFLWVIQGGSPKALSPRSVKMVA